MKIGIIGSGNIGGTLGTLWAKAGHGVLFSSRHPEQLETLAREAGNGARAGTQDEAAGFGEVVLLAIPWRERATLPAADRFAGKTVIDAMNPYSATGGVTDLGESTSSEEVAKQLPGAHVVKAFNTIHWRRLRDEGRTDDGQRLAVFVAGDEAEAKAVVSRLIEQIGFAPVDTGSLRDGGRKQQPGSAIYSVPLTAGEARQLLRA